MRMLVNMQRAKQQNCAQRDKADRHYKEDEVPHDLILLVTWHVPAIPVILLARLHILPEGRRRLEDLAWRLEVLALHLLIIVGIAVIRLLHLLLPAHALTGISWRVERIARGAAPGGRLLWELRRQCAQGSRVAQPVAIGCADDRGAGE